MRARLQNLKQAIKAQSDGLITVPWPTLALSLAKKNGGNGPWVTEAEAMEGVTDTTGLKRLGSLRLEVGDAGLSANAVKIQLTTQELADMKGPIHVLVAVPEQRGQLYAEDIQEEKTREAIIRFSRQIAESRATLPHKSTSSHTTGALGAKEYRKLDSNNLIIDTSPVENGEAFWSEEIQTQVDAITKKADFDAFVTPYFNDVLGRSGMVFVKSAEYPWLSQSLNMTKSTYLKPDGFATHAGMYRAEPDTVQPTDGFRIGVPEEEFGTISAEHFPTAAACAVLFDCRSFWLISSYKGVVSKIEKATWTREGSKDSFLNFITRNISPSVARLTNACSSLRVKVVEGTAFLGRGAFGRVFKTKRQGGEILALKIADQDSVERLHEEKQALANAQDTCLTIRAVEEISEIRVGPVTGAALLLCPVGKPLPQPKTQVEVERLFELLRQLHAKGWAHVVVSDGKLLWIDLVRVMKASNRLKKWMLPSSHDPFSASTMTLHWILYWSS